MIGATPPLATLRILMSARPDVLERLDSGGTEPSEPVGDVDHADAFVLGVLDE